MQSGSNVERVNQDKKRVDWGHHGMIAECLLFTHSFRSCKTSKLLFYIFWCCCLLHQSLYKSNMYPAWHVLCPGLVDIPCPHVWHAHKYHQLQKSSALMEVVIIKLNGIITKLMNWAPLLNLMYIITSCPNGFQKVFSHKISLVCWARVSSWWGAQTWTRDYWLRFSRVFYH